MISSRIFTVAVEGEVPRRLAAVCQLEVVVSRKGSSKLAVSRKMGVSWKLAVSQKVAISVVGQNGFGSCCG